MRSCESANVRVRIVRFSTAAKSLALWVTKGTFNCRAAAAIHASANVMGRPFFSHPLLIRAHARAVSVSSRRDVKRVRKRCINSRRPEPQFFTSIQYSISASVIKEIARGRPARMA